jgi:hypothetical protein
MATVGVSTFQVLMAPVQVMVSYFTECAVHCTRRESRLVLASDMVLMLFVQQVLEGVIGRPERHPSGTHVVLILDSAVPTALAKLVWLLTVTFRVATPPVTT